MIDSVVCLYYTSMLTHGNTMRGGLLHCLLHCSSLPLGNWHHYHICLYKINMNYYISKNRYRYIYIYIYIHYFDYYYSESITNIHKMTNSNIYIQIEIVYKNIYLK